MTTLNLNKDEKDLLLKLFKHEYLVFMKGYERYEKLRKLNPKQFLELWEECLKMDVRFDDQVDKLK